MRQSLGRCEKLMESPPYESIAKDLEREFRLRRGFFHNLLDEDDWSFVVKVHALVEAGVAQLLTGTLGDERLARVLERLELSNTTIGKLAFAKALGLMRKEELTFVRSLSELRNQLVHNVHNVHFSFADQLTTFDSNQRRTWQQSISYFATGTSSEEYWRGEALQDPKTTIWYGVMSLLTHIYLALERVRTDRTVTSMRLEVLQAMFPRQSEAESDD
jgi:hypothetical protein